MCVVGLDLFIRSGGRIDALFSSSRRSLAVGGGGCGERRHLPPHGQTPLLPFSVSHRGSSWVWWKGSFE